jgi:hypothetical protein
MTITLPDGKTVPLEGCIACQTNRDEHGEIGIGIDWRGQNNTLRGKPEDLIRIFRSAADTIEKRVVNRDCS